MSKGAIPIEWGPCSWRERTLQLEREGPSPDPLLCSTGGTVELLDADGTPAELEDLRQSMAKQKSLGREHCEIRVGLSVARKAGYE